MNNVRAQGLNLSLGLPGGSGAGGGAPGSSSRPRVTPSLQLTPSPADALRSNAVRNSVRYIFSGFCGRNSALHFHQLEFLVLKG